MSSALSTCRGRLMVEILRALVLVLCAAFLAWSYWLVAEASSWSDSKAMLLFVVLFFPAVLVGVVAYFTCRRNAGAILRMFAVLSMGVLFVATYSVLDRLLKPIEEWAQAEGHLNREVLVGWPIAFIKLLVAFYLARKFLIFATTRGDRLIARVTASISPLSES